MAKSFQLQWYIFTENGGEELIRTEGDQSPGQSFERCDTHGASGYLESGCCAPEFPIATDVRPVSSVLLAHLRG